MVNYVRDLYETYTLESLDRGNLPDEPIKPNKPLNLALGGLMGLIVGAGMAFLAAYLQAPPESVTSVSVLDEDTGVYNQRYLTMRLRQELSRARRNGYPLALALMNVDHRGTLADASEQLRREALRRVALLLTPQLRDEDTMAYFGGTVFAFLLPDLTGDDAKAHVERLQMIISASPVELERSNIALDLRCSAGIVAYSEHMPESGAEADILLEQANRSLKESETATYGRVFLSAENGSLATTADARSIVSA
jgi:diguanylate cyclase (GGDEF)-like protein